MAPSIEGVAQNPSLLVIDDQPENIRLLVRILSQAGYLNITTATDPSRVSELHALCKPDIVLLDLHMPAYDGFAVLEKLAPFTHGVERLPVVMITADDSSEVKRRAFARSQGFHQQAVRSGGSRSEDSESSGDPVPSSGAPPPRRDRCRAWSSLRPGSGRGADAD